MRRTVIALVLAAAFPSLAAAERPRTLMQPVQVPPESIPSVVSTHVLYLNPCKPSGCVVKSGATDSRTDHSDIGQGTIAAYSGNDASWQQVVSCVKQVMSPFNITVTDVDPGSADHFEVMIGGSPSNMGLPSGVGGIAPVPDCTGIGQCSPYIPNALVFDFERVWQGNTLDICGTAAQEIAHAWALDHTIYNSDPMTYNGYTNPLSYRDNATCGSDCGYSCPDGFTNCNAFGLHCAGSGGSATHTCFGSGQATQNEVGMIKAVFGPAGAKDPTVAITSPTNGGAVQTGQPFEINATCASNDSATLLEIDLSIDGMAKASLKTSPAMFSGPTTLTAGTHKIDVQCATTNQASATASITVIVGDLCSQDSDCPMGDICYSNACTAGPDTVGGLGATCTTNSDCKSGSCANDGSQSLCVLPCDPANDHCPSGFGCVQAGAAGVCWFGASNGGGGCCDTGGDSRGSILLGLVFAAALITRRQPRSLPQNRR